MKKFVISTLCLASTLALADCHIRSSVRLKSNIVEAGPVDVQKLVTPDAEGQQCVLRYRVYVHGTWQTAEGVATAKRADEACARAIDISRGSLLEEPTAKNVNADTQMVCSDLDEIKIHPVRVGDVIWESETDLHFHPDERKPFDYKGATCRWFSERDIRDQNLWLYQGIICRVDSTQHSKWRVIDKF
jgi:hypothetical protein